MKLKKIYINVHQDQIINRDINKNIQVSYYNNLLFQAQKALCNKHNTLASITQFTVSPCIISLIKQANLILRPSHAINALLLDTQTTAHIIISPKIKDL